MLSIYERLLFWAWGVIILLLMASFALMSFLPWQAFAYLLWSMAFLGVVTPLWLCLLVAYRLGKRRQFVRATILCVFGVWSLLFLRNFLYNSSCSDGFGASNQNEGTACVDPPALVWEMSDSPWIPPL